MFNLFTVLIESSKWFSDRTRQLFWIEAAILFTTKHSVDSLFKSLASWTECVLELVQAQEDITLRLFFCSCQSFQLFCAYTLSYKGILLFRVKGANFLRDVSWYRIDCVQLGTRIKPLLHLSDSSLIDVCEKYGKVRWCIQNTTKWVV